MNTERVVSQKITKKYFEALKVAKDEIESNVFILKQWESKFKMSHRTMTTLKNLNIIKDLSISRKKPSYEWNSRIPITMLLAKKVVLENAKIRAVYIKKLALNKSKKPAVKEVVKPITRPKVKQVVKPIQVAKKVSDVGLIRKFLRWIY